ncbi:hypothetical protein C8R43DRAFT_943283 [Mycena crocata]|nr:hypothetical protein C8R43DRAFT_943283 [Mycena crocata]
MLNTLLFAIFPFKRATCVNGCSLLGGEHHLVEREWSRGTYDIKRQECSPANAGATFRGFFGLFGREKFHVTVTDLQKFNSQSLISIRHSTGCLKAQLKFRKFPGSMGHDKNSTCLDLGGSGDRPPLGSPSLPFQSRQSRAAYLMVVAAGIPNRGLIWLNPYLQLENCAL